MSEAKATSIIPLTKRLLQEQMARYAMGDFETYRQRVIQDGTIDDLRRLNEMIQRMAGLEVDKAADLFAHLPTLNFVFHQAGAPVPPPAPKPTELAEDVTPRALTPLPPHTHQPVDMADLLDMVADLDDKP